MPDVHAIHSNPVLPSAKSACRGSATDASQARGGRSCSAMVDASHAHHGAGRDGASRAALTTSATLHCLSGCALGEFAGLAIGVGLGLDPWATMALATVLGFLSGYTLGLWPLVRQGTGWLAAFRRLWLGETVSIASMELAMNLTDYHVGGVTAPSLLAWRFWAGYLLALAAGFVVAWPVNWWLLRRNIKQPCH